MSRYVVGATWDDAPHLSAEVKTALLASIPAYQRDARSKGIPQLGAGAIYPIAESDVVIPPFEIPAHFRRGYGLDVGWNRTAAAFLAFDPDAGVSYLYSEHYRGEAEPSTHGQAILARGRLRSDLDGRWLPGRIDPAARGRSQVDGQQLLTKYRDDLGLNLTAATNAVETGIYAVWTALSEGRLRVFSTCTNWLSEYRLYRRDERGRVIKKHDHLMDATRYAVIEGPGWLLPVPPVSRPLPPPPPVLEGSGGLGWMG